MLSGRVADAVGASSLQLEHKVFPDGETYIRFPESVAGKESLIYLAPAFLDTLGIPYTGVRTQGMMLTTGNTRRTKT